LIPEAVKNEFDEELPDCCEIIKVDYSSVESLKAQRNIGSGEASVIIYSLNIGDKITCFIDEQKARKIAKDRNLKVSGTIGILMRMEEKNLISSAYEETLVLKEKGFHISDKILEDLFA
jgi:predicted nucleic acid-binding protein